LNIPLRLQLDVLCILWLLSDLAYAVGKATQQMSKSTTGLWKFIKRILRYLKGIVELGITYSKSSNNFL